MMNNIYFLLIMVYITQIIPALFFKFGSKWKNGSLPFLAFYLGGNLVGASSMAFAMKFYGLMEANPNLAAAVIGGGAFVATQVAFAIVFYKELNLQKIIGVIIASVGLIFMILYAPATSSAAEETLPKTSPAGETIQ